MAHDPVDNSTGTAETIQTAFGKINADVAELFGAKTVFVANFAALPVTGVAGVVYVTTDNDAMYRWDGAAYDDLGGVQFVANAAALPVVGEALKIYVTLDNGRMQHWNSSAYVTLGGITFDIDGNIVANVNHRTGTLADLLTIDGGGGEISVAIESGAAVGLVLHNGVANEAKGFVRSSIIGEVHAWSNATSLTGGSTTTLLDFSAKTVETGRGNLDLTTNMATIPAGCAYIQCQGYVYFGTDADITAGTKLKVVAECELLTGVWIALGTIVQTAVAAAADENKVVYDFFSIADLSASWASGTMRFRLRVEHNDATDVYSGIQGSMALRFYGKN